MTFLKNKSRKKFYFTRSWIREQIYIDSTPPPPPPPQKKPEDFRQLCLYLNLGLHARFYPILHPFLINVALSIKWWLSEAVKSESFLKKNSFKSTIKMKVKVLNCKGSLKMS